MGTPLDSWAVRTLWEARQIRGNNPHLTGYTIMSSGTSMMLVGAFFADLRDALMTKEIANDW